MKKYLFKSATVLLSAALLSSFVMAGPVLANEKGASQTQAQREALVHSQVTSAPVVTLKLWQDSSPNERYAFLIGFVSMLELEKEWQGDKPVPFKQSLVHAWVKGLDGITVKDMYMDIENHIKANPTDMNRPVIQVLWDDMVQPKMSEIISSADASHKKPAGKKSGVKK